MTDGLADPFDTARLRARVLDAWAASPSRFREDANAEEDYALGGYRDRVIVELAQNAADAAVRGGVPGRLRLTLRDGVLTAANTGAPLDAAGVEALSTLRASSKRDGGDGGTVGRFGVGFAAVVAVSDSPRIWSTAGAVRWSRDRARELAGGIGSLAGEIAARGGHVPVLRLPFADQEISAGAAGDWTADGFQTVVELPLRDTASVALVTRLLGEAGPALLLALPALARVEIEADGGTRVLTAVHDDMLSVITVDGVPSRWRVAAAGGGLDPALLAGRPAEERARTSWSVRWAVPAGEDGQPTGRLPDGVSPVLHAPTPTDEPLGLPALLLASFPLSPDRRHVAPGPLTGFLIDQAARSYAGLLPQLAPGPALLDLVPGPVGKGELDARLSRAIVALLPDVPFLPGVAAAGTAADTPATPCPSGYARGTRCCLTAARPGSMSSSRRCSRTSAPGRAGIRRGRCSACAGCRSPSWPTCSPRSAGSPPGGTGCTRRWPAPHRRSLPSSVRCRFRLRTGGWCAGRAGCCCPAPGSSRRASLPCSGCGWCTPRRRTRCSPGSARPTARRAVRLRTRPPAPPSPRPTTGRPRLTTTTTVPCGWPARYSAWSPRCAPRLASTRGSPTSRCPRKTATGTRRASCCSPAHRLRRSSRTTRRSASSAPASRRAATPAPWRRRASFRPSGCCGRRTSRSMSQPPTWTWTAPARGPPTRGTACGSRVTGRRRCRRSPSSSPPCATWTWSPRTTGRRPLELLTRPPLRAALTEPARVRLPDGSGADVPSYTAWWLGRHVTLGGRRPSELRAPDADSLLAGLYDMAGGETTGQDAALGRVLADPLIARALGVRSSLAALLAEPGGADDLLARLADPARPVTRPQLRALWSALAADGGLAPDDVTPPDRVRAVLEGELVVADADDVLVLDAPDLLPLAVGRPLILAPYRHAPRLADLLDLPLASDEVPGNVKDAGDLRPVPGVLRDVLPGALATYREHDALAADGTDVPWRYTGGEVHAATADGLAHGIAWAAGCWSARQLLASLLTDPGDTSRLLAEADLDG